MGLLRFNYRSEAVGGYVDVTIAYPTDEFSYLPLEQRTRIDPVAGKLVKDGYEPGMKFQTIYVIHGGGDNDDLTCRYTNVERYAQKNKVMLVIPGVMNSFGANTRYNVNYSTFIGVELPKVVQALFASSTAWEDNFIAGYAMGGNAALANALMHPESFCHCVDMSGGIGFTLDTETFKTELDSDHFRNNFKLYGSTFGPSSELAGSDLDLYTIAKDLLASGKPLPKFNFIAGSLESFILERVKNDARIMKELGFDADIKIYEGMKHDFDLWDVAFRYVLDELLPLKRRAIYPNEK